MHQPGFIFPIAPARLGPVWTVGGGVGLDVGAGVGATDPITLILTFTLDWPPVLIPVMVNPDC